MVMKSGENWHCVNPVCGCSVVVESGGKGAVRSRRLSGIPYGPARPALPPMARDEHVAPPRDDLPYQRSYVDHSRIRP
jgi:hypothetical protein